MKFTIEQVANLIERKPLTEGLIRDETLLDKFGNPNKRYYSKQDRFDKKLLDIVKRNAMDELIELADQYMFVSPDMPYDWNNESGEEGLPLKIAVNNGNKEMASFIRNHGGASYLDSFDKETKEKIKNFLNLK